MSAYELAVKNRKWLRLGALVGLMVGCFLLCACGPSSPLEAPKPFDAAFLTLSPVEVAQLPLATRFTMPMGGEQGALVYNAQIFRRNRHLGDDLNGIGGWNSDLGDPVYASGIGRVIYAGDPSPGWGNVVILAHRVQEQQPPREVAVYQTVYAHLDTIEVQVGQIVRRGQRLGTVGTAHGRYLAHLHFEVRKSRSVYPGPGYAEGPLDRVSPQVFLKAYGAAGEKGIAPPTPLVKVD